jgi:hypothetical protein
MVATGENVRCVMEKKLAESVKKENELRVALDSGHTQVVGVLHQYGHALTIQLKTQLKNRTEAEELAQKKRIDAEEEKAMLTAQLEAAESFQKASTGALDGTELDTYRVSSPMKRPSLII